MISAYSFCSAVVFYNVCLCIVFVLRQRTSFLTRYTSSALTILTVLGLIRLFTPIDLQSSLVIRSEVVLPAVVRALGTEIDGVGVSWGYALLAIWGIGIVGIALRDILQEYVSYRLRESYIYIDSPQAEKLAADFGNYQVKVSPQVSVPYVTGLFKPVIFLPDIQLSEAELRFVLRHEIQHITSHDMLKKLLFLSIEVLFWWNPLAHISLSEIDAILEIQCDAKLTSMMNEAEVHEYMRTLLSVMKQINRDKEKNELCTTALLGKRQGIRQRFEVMLAGKYRKSKWKPVVLNCVFVVLFLLSYMVILQPGFSPPMEDISEVMEICPDTAYIIAKDGTYYLFYNGTPVFVIPEDSMNSSPYNELKIVEDY